MFQRTATVSPLVFPAIFKGSNIPDQRLGIAVNRMADKFKGGELWIGNWGSNEDLKVIQINYYHAQS